MTDLTDRQREVLDFIAAGIRRNRPPTYREVMEHFGWCGTNAVGQHVRALVRKGVLEVDPRKARGLRLTKAAKKRLTGLPLLDMATLKALRRAGKGK